MPSSTLSRSNFPADLEFLLTPALLSGAEGTPAQGPRTVPAGYTMGMPKAWESHWGSRGSPVAGVRAETVSKSNSFCDSESSQLFFSALSCALWPTATRAPMFLSPFSTSLSSWPPSSGALRDDLPSSFQQPRMRMRLASCRAWWVMGPAPGPGAPAPSPGPDPRVSSASKASSRDVVAVKSRTHAHWISLHPNKAP